MNRSALGGAASSTLGAAALLCLFAALAGRAAFGPRAGLLSGFVLAVGFVPVGGHAALARPAAVELRLDVVGRHAEAGGASVDDHTHAPAVGFAEGRDAKESTEGRGHDYHLVGVRREDSG